MARSRWPGRPGWTPGRPGHRERAYEHLMNEQDREMFRWVRKFNPYDLYTKCDHPPDLNALMPYYRDLVDESETTSSLIHYSRSRSRTSLRAHRVLMLMIEELAPLYYTDTREQLFFLNRQYEINNEIAELWLRGYGNLATRLSDPDQL